MSRRKRSREDLERIKFLTSQETPLTRVCTICLTIKPISEFTRKRKMRKGINSQCKECDNDIRIQHRFGISMIDYARMLQEQDGRCAICGSPDPKYGKKRFHIDHDHISGCVRGLLCSDCNTGIGLFKDDVKLLANASAYLSRRKMRYVS